MRENRVREIVQKEMALEHRVDEAIARDWRETRVREIVREEIGRVPSRVDKAYGVNDPIGDAVDRKLAELGITPIEPDTGPTDEPMFVCGPIKPLTQEALDEYAEVSGIQLVLAKRGELG